MPTTTPTTNEDNNKKKHIKKKITMGGGRPQISQATAAPGPGSANQRRAFDADHTASNADAQWRTVSDPRRYGEETTSPL